MLLLDDDDDDDDSHSHLRYYSVLAKDVNLSVLIFSYFICCEQVS